MITALWPLSVSIAFCVGWTTSRIQVRKREAPGRVSRDDFSWPGKPLHIIEAETIDAALRGDL